MKSFPIYFPYSIGIRHVLNSENYIMNELLRNPGHHFGYIQLPHVIDTLYPEDKEEICWSPSALIEREIYKSEVDVWFRVGELGIERYLGKVTELKTSVRRRFLRIDTTACEAHDFEILVKYVEINRPVYQHRAFLTSMHIDAFITQVHLEASTLHEEGTPVDTVLNRVMITLVC